MFEKHTIVYNQDLMEEEIESSDRDSDYIPNSEDEDFIDNQEEPQHYDEQA